MITRRDCLLTGMRMVVAGILLGPVLARAEEAPATGARRPRLRPRQALPPESFAASVRCLLTSGETPCHLQGDAVRITAADVRWDPAKRGFRISLNYDQLQPKPNSKRLRLALIGLDGKAEDEELFTLPEAVAGKKGPLGLSSTAADSITWSTRRLSAKQRTLELSWAD